MSLPKPGVKPEDLKCKICQKKAAEQPNDIETCAHEFCPFKGKAASVPEEGE